MQAMATETFIGNMRGPVIRPMDADYDAVRSLYNGMIDKSPVMIARCTDVADVVAAVNFARQNDLQVAIRCAPLEGPPQAMQVEINGHGLGTVELAPGMRDYVLSLPRAALVAGTTRRSGAGWAGRLQPPAPGGRQAHKLPGDCRVGKLAGHGVRLPGGLATGQIRRRAAHGWRGRRPGRRAAVGPRSPGHRRAGLARNLHGPVGGERHRGAPSPRSRSARPSPRGPCDGAAGTNREAGRSLARRSLDHARPAPCSAWGAPSAASARREVGRRLR